VQSKLRGVLEHGSAGTEGKIIILKQIFDKLSGIQNWIYLYSSSCSTTITLGQSERTSCVKLSL